MANKLIKESILTSKSLALCSWQADLAWSRILFCGDDWGCFNADPQAVKARAFPKRNDISIDTVSSWLQEYEDNDMLFRWKIGDREYGYFINNSKHNSEYRSRWHKRKTLPPPENLLIKYLQEHSIPFKDIQDGSVIFEDVPTTSKDFQGVPSTPDSCPTPTPKPTPTHKPKKKKRVGKSQETMTEDSPPNPNGESGTKRPQPSDHLPDSSFYNLAKRIIENAASLDAPKVGLNKDTPKQREKRIQDSAEDIRKLIETSWKPWDAKKALALANRIWSWVVDQEDKPGFMWKRNIKCGRTFRYHLDSQLKHKGKSGGELLRQYRVSPEYKALCERKAQERHAARMRAELEEVKTEAKTAEDEEARLAKILKEQGKEAWARTFLFEMLGFKDLATVKADPFLGQTERAKKAVKILEAAT
ncbi:hypothetical protein ES703_28428 [subsurface metagenome]